MKKKNYQKEIINELIDLYSDLDFIENAYKQEIQLLKEVKKYGKKAN